MSRVSEGALAARGPRAPLLVIVQARLSSSRLPGKVLIEVAGRSLLGHLLTRLRRSSYEHTAVVATTTQPADDRVEAEARRFGAAVFRGSEMDVLARFAGALAEHPADVVVRLTADNPLLDPAELDRVVGELLARGDGPEALDYVTNHAPVGGRLPLGLDVEALRAAALRRAHREASDPGDREHVTAYLYRVSGRFRVLRTPHPSPERARFRLTVDTPQDLELVRRVLEALGPDAELPAIARFLGDRPEIAGLNAGVVQRSIEGEMELRRRRVRGRYLIGRADASLATGLGHAMRVGTLLEAWTELGGRALLVGRGVRGSLAARLAAAGVERAEPRGATPAQDAADVLERARACGAPAIALDGYTFDARYHEALQAERTLLALDDLAAQRQVADLVLNQNLDFDRARYGAGRAGQRWLIGAPYVLLRRALRERLGPRCPAPEGRGAPRVVIGFGGSDPLSLTEPVLDALLAELPSARVDVLLGPGVTPALRERLSERCRGEPRATLHADAPEIAPILLAADVSISAAGVTVWETLALGVPSVLVTLADNQRAVSEPVVARGAALDAGGVDRATPERAAALTRALLEDPERRARLIEAGRGLLDGRGVWRVIDALLDAIEERSSTA